jgi:hypothetical protein
MLRNHIDGNEGKNKILRYIDFPSFLALLQNEALHFSRVSSFEDKYDGMFNCLNADDFYYITDERKIVRSDSASLDSRSSEDSAIIREIIKSYHQLWLNGTGVNCWRIDEGESHAMWRAYLKSDEGVAIESTVDNLKRALLPGNYKIDIRRVKYIDYSQEKIPIGSIFNAFFYKNRYFEHEKELRLICYILNQKMPEPVPLEYPQEIPKNGVNLRVDLSSLITAIYISPYAASWFGDIVDAVAKRFALQVKVRPSIIKIKKGLNNNYP